MNTGVSPDPAGSPRMVALSYRLNLSITISTGGGGWPHEMDPPILRQPRTGVG
jgi:hypothetical protein